MPNFPISFDDDASLYLAVNNLRTKLTSSIDASTLVIPVVTTSGFPQSGFVTITSNPSIVTNPEAVSYSGIDSTNFYATARGADGTSAKSHGAGANADLNVLAAHHNELKDAVIELEHFVGVSGSENFLRQDDNGDVSISGDLNVAGSGTIPLLGGTTLTFTSGNFYSSLSVSGTPVATGTGGVTDHGNLTGLLDDDHTQYILVDGTRAFTGTVAGITPILDAHLSTKGYVDVEIVTHAGIADAHHVRYTKSENDAILGTDGNTVISGSNTITVQGFRPEAVTISGFLQSQIDNISVGTEPAIVGSDGITVISGANSTQIVGFYNEFVSASGSLQGQIDDITPQLPAKETLDFTTGVVDRAGGVRDINQSFNNRSLVRKLKITPTVAGVNSYVVQFYTKDSFDFDDRLEYEATSSGVYVDNQVWFHEDEDLTGEIHLRITNTSLFDSTFQVEILAERFF